jgi:hypothetical protein
MKKLLYIYTEPRKLRVLSMKKSSVIFHFLDKSNMKNKILIHLRSKIKNQKPNAQQDYSRIII